jgi:hypothetical protein
MESETQIDLQTLGSLVRNWVHYDTLIGNINKQVLATRRERETYEKQILQLLKTYKYEKAVIQISGGKLMVHNEKHSQPLTFSSLESLLHDYYKHKKPGAQDETAAIVKFIKENRSIETGLKLKRVMNSG